MNALKRDESKKKHGDSKLAFPPLLAKWASQESSSEDSRKDT